MNRILLAISVLLLSGIVILKGKLSELEQERDRLRDNQAALMAQTEQYRTADGKNAARVRQLELTVSELEEENGLIASTAEGLRLRLRQIESASAHATHTDVAAQTVIRDTLVIRDSIVTTMQGFLWSDSWTRVAGIIDGRDVKLAVSSRDTLVQIVHRVPHRFLFFTWGCKGIRQEIVSSNPHTTITYSEYIKVK